MSHKVKLHINVLCSSMESWILCKAKRTMTITPNSNLSCINTNIRTQSPKLNGFLTRMSTSHVLIFYSGQSNHKLSLTHPIDGTTKHSEHITTGGSPAINITYPI